MMAANLLATTKKRKSNELRTVSSSGLTVHQYLENEKKKIIEAVQAALGDQVNRLRAEFEEGKVELEKELETLLEGNAGDEENGVSAANQEGVATEAGEKAGKGGAADSENVAANSSSPSDTADAKEPQKKTSKAILRVHVAQGEHAGEKFTFKKSNRMQVMIGRSTGKRFKKGGISLPKDGEVSTTHGKIWVVKGDICFTDLGSTNGSFLNGEELENRVPYILNHNDKLRVGQCILHCTHEEF